MSSFVEVLGLHISSFGRDFNNSTYLTCLSSYEERPILEVLE